MKLFFDNLYSSGLKIGTLKMIRASFRGVMNYAVDSEIIEHNPFNGLRFNYKNDRADINHLTESETFKLLDAAEVYMEGKYYPALLLTLRTGMRIGEIQALRWSDVDFDRRSIEVQRSWRKGRTTQTKSKRRRLVDMSSALCKVLRQHYTDERKKALRDGHQASKLVFTRKRDEMLNRIVFQNALNRCCEKAGLRKIRTHDLRPPFD